MITKSQYLRDRDRAIYDHFIHGKRQRWLAKHYELSVSRIKAICSEQRKLAGK
jgi:Mor family transcriptional regulator